MKKIIVSLIVLSILAMWFYMSATVNLGVVIVYVIIPWIGLIIAWNILKYLISTNKDYTNIVLSWAKKHINWTWCGLYIVTLLIAFSMMEVVMNLPPITSASIVEEHTTLYSDNGSHVDVPFTHGVVEEDKESTDNRNKLESALWFYPLYWIGSYKATKWALDTKKVSLIGVWIISLFVPFIVLFLKGNI